MSVLCTHFSNLLLNLIHQARPKLVGQPLAILDEEERIVALSAQAGMAGVTAAMTPQRAQLKCPEIGFQDLNLPTFRETQRALLDTLTEWELPTEEAGWGLAYVDMHLVTKDRGEVQTLAAELGSRLRRALGNELQPAIGWDSGKFTAKAAAVRTRPGTMKLIDAKREVPFLTPLPVTLLPLPLKQLRWLNRLGIYTLGQFGGLPPTKVRRALGKEGLAAQQWALGKDDRPVVDSALRRFEPLAVDFATPTGQLPQVATAVMNQLYARLDQLAVTYCGIRQIELTLHFDADRRPLTLTFVEPTADSERIERQLTRHLESLIWPGYLHKLTVVDLHVAELAPPEQLSLFDNSDAAPLEPTEWLAGLRQRYGAIRQQGQIHDPTHPVAHRRATFQPIG